MNKIEKAIYDVKLHIADKQRQLEILRAQLTTLEAELATLEAIQEDDSIPNETKTIGTMKEQETIEETAEIFYSEQSKAYEDATEPMFDNSRYLVAGFIDGAKWQQEQYYKETFKQQEQ
jgi:cobalamin biosynthesis protein CbiD